jgi:hypothetical protein
MNKSIIKILSSIITIGLCVFAIWFGTKKLEERAFERGRASITCSCELSDICDKYEEKGFSADYEHGVRHTIYSCWVYSGKARIEDDFMFEGDWDRCDDNGNCQPFVKNGEYVN